MRYEERHEKKKRPLRKFMLLILLLIAVAGAYALFQYKQGVNESRKIAGDKEKIEYEFSGQKDQYGGTNILLLGSDKDGGRNSRADTIMIVHYNEDKGSYKVTSIMRDSYVKVPGHGELKINSAFALGGPDLVRKTIKENFDIDLQYYAILDFRGFVQLVDEAFPEGVEVDVEKRMKENIGVTLEPGRQRLDGEHLLGYVRFRQDAVGDFGRVERQQKVVGILANELTTVTTLPKLPKLVGIVMPFVNTNMNAKDLLFMARNFVKDGTGNVETLRIPVKDAFYETRVSGQGAVLALDMEKNKQALHQFITK